MWRVVFAGFMLAAAPAFAQSQAVAQSEAGSQAPGPNTSYQRHEASRAFGRAGHSAAETARATGRGLSHGWQATKQGVTSGWNKVTGDGDTR